MSVAQERVEKCPGCLHPDHAPKLCRELVMNGNVGQGCACRHGVKLPPPTESEEPDDGALETDFDDEPTDEELEELEHQGAERSDDFPVALLLPANIGAMIEGLADTGLFGRTSDDVVEGLILHRLKELVDEGWFDVKA